MKVVPASRAGGHLGKGLGMLLGKSLRPTRTGSLRCGVLYVIAWTTNLIIAVPTAAMNTLQPISARICNQVIIYSKARNRPPHNAKTGSAFAISEVAFALCLHCAHLSGV